MTDEIQQAMTPEEWAAVGDKPELYADFGGSICCGDLFLDHRPQAIAAVALFCQPFGFTREDVRRLRDTDRHDADAAYLAELSTRIATLLPPES